MATAIYIDAEPTGFAYRDSAERVLVEAGYQWLPPFLGASANVAQSQFARSLPAAAMSADVVVLRFRNAPLEDQWAFPELRRLQEFGGLVVVVLDAANHWAKARLDAALDRPSFLIESPDSLATTLRAAVPRAAPS